MAAGGAMSQIVEYSFPGGKVERILTVKGHNDGLRLDPATNQLWALQNEDANPKLVVIDPITGITVKYKFAAPPPHGGGYDDIVFTNGAGAIIPYISASAPTLDANGKSIGPSIVKATLVAASHTVEVTPVVSGTPFAVNIPFGTLSQLNLTDPDSMKMTPSGEILLVTRQTGCWYSGRSRRRKRRCDSCGCSGGCRSTTRCSQNPITVSCSSPIATRTRAQFTR
jgi:hypothetical protein